MNGDYFVILRIIKITERAYDKGYPCAFGAGPQELLLRLHPCHIQRAHGRGHRHQAKVAGACGAKQGRCGVEQEGNHPCRRTHPFENVQKTGGKRGGTASRHPSRSRRMILIDMKGSIPVFE